MDKSDEIFDDDIINVINALRITLHSFKNMQTSNSVLQQKNKLLNEELQSIKKNESSDKQDEILKGISQKLQKNNAILDGRMANLQAELKVAVQLNRKYKNDIDVLEEKYINEIQTLNEDHAKEIRRLKAEFQNKSILSRKTINFNSVLSKEEHTMKLDELKAQNSTKIMELKLEHVDAVEEYERAIEKLNGKIIEVTTQYDKIKEKCDNIEKQLTASRENKNKLWSPHDDEIFANRPNHLKSIDKPTKSNIEPSFTTKITKPNDAPNQIVTAVIEHPKKRKLFNPRSEIIYLNNE